MKKLNLQSDGSYTVTNNQTFVADVLTIVGAPFTGLAGTAHAPGQARANTLMSLAIGGALGATIAYPIIRKGIKVASLGKADSWLAETHAANQSASL